MIQIKALQIRLLFFFFFLCVLVNTKIVVNPNLPKYSLKDFKDYMKTEPKTIVIFVSLTNDIKEDFYSFYYKEYKSVLTDFEFIEVDKIEDFHLISDFQSPLQTFIVYKNGKYKGKTFDYLNKKEFEENLKSISNKKDNSWQPLDVQKYSLDTFKQYMKSETNKTIVVVVSTKGYKSEAFYSDYVEIGSKLKDFVFIEVDKIEDFHPIRIFPTLLVYKNGKYIDKIIGFSNKKDYIETLKSISEQNPNPSQPSF